MADNTLKIAACTQWDDHNIKGFFGEYRYLSNFHKVPILYKHVIYGSTEAAYMSGKSNDPEYIAKLKAITDPKEAKAEGRKVKLVSNWEQIKDEVMYEVNLFKYTFYPDLKAALLKTGSKHLEESNWWKDDYWGTVDGVGRNQLGKTLMEVRKDIQLLGWGNNSTTADYTSAENAIDLLNDYLKEKKKL